MTLVIFGSYLKTNHLRIFILPQELNKVSVQLDQVTAKLNDKQEYCAQLEANLKEYKEKRLYLEQKTEELEGQRKVCIEHVSELTETDVLCCLIVCDKSCAQIMGEGLYQYHFCRFSFSPVFPDPAFNLILLFFHASISH